MSPLLTADGDFIWRCIPSGVRTMLSPLRVSVVWYVIKSTLYSAALAVLCQVHTTIESKYANIIKRAISRVSSGGTDADPPSTRAGALGSPVSVEAGSPVSVEAGSLGSVALAFFFAFPVFAAFTVAGAEPFAVDDAVAKISVKCT